MAARTYPELLALVAQGKLRPGDLVTREIGLDEAPAALAAMGDGGPPGVTVIRP
jgi:alcohol dehydrogenase